MHIQAQFYQHSDSGPYSEGHICFQILECLPVFLMHCCRAFSVSVAVACGYLTPMIRFHLGDQSGCEPVASAELLLKCCLPPLCSPFLSQNSVYAEPGCKMCHDPEWPGFPFQIPLTLNFGSVVFLSVYLPISGFLHIPHLKVPEHVLESDAVLPH